MTKSKQLLSLLSIFTVCTLIVAGCGKKAEEPSSMVDLSKASDIFKAPPASLPPVDPSTVVVTVDGKEITQGSIDKEITSMMSRAGRSLPPERMAQMRAQMTQQVLDSLIIRTLLRNAIDVQDIQIEESEIEEGLARLSGSLPPDVTMEQQLQKLQLTEQELREALSLDLRINKLIMSQMDDLEEPSDEEVAAFYEENAERFNVPETVEARHILISLKPKTVTAC